MRKEPHAAYRTDDVYFFRSGVGVRENAYPLAWMGSDDVLDGAVPSCVLHLSALFVIGYPIYFIEMVGFEYF
jgi:hypothetical protein